MKFDKFVDAFELNTKGGGKLKTSIKPEDRSFKNLPRYSNKKARVDFKDWLMIKGEGGTQGGKGRVPTPNYYGKSEADGKWYGWSHRAVYGFKEGDKIAKDTIGNDTGKEYTLKGEPEAKELAIKFAKGVS